MESKEIIVKLVEDTSKDGFSGIFDGTLVAAILTVIATLVAVFFTNRHNKKIENSKVKREKLEELHGLVFPLGNVFLSKKEQLRYLPFYEVKKIYGKFYLSRSRITILVNTYFHKDLSSKTTDLLEQAELIFDYLKLQALPKMHFELHRAVENQSSILSRIQDAIDEYPNYDNIEEYNDAEKALDSLVTEMQSLSDQEVQLKNTFKEDRNADLVAMISNFEKMRNDLLQEIIQQSNKTFK